MRPRSRSWVPTYWTPTATDEAPPRPSPSPMNSTPALTFALCSGTAVRLARLRRDWGKRLGHVSDDQMTMKTPIVAVSVA